MFDESFIEKLPSDPILAGKSICEAFFDFNTRTAPGKEQIYYEEYLKAITILESLCEANDFNVTFTRKRPSEIFEKIKTIKSDYIIALNFFNDLHIESNVDEYKKKFEHKFGKGFFYEFSDGDIKRVQLLIGELREILSTTKDMDEEHRLRLLKRLEKLQSELHKRVTGLDRFWGLLIDGSIVLKKVGENAKPIVDRIQEIVNIVWRVQARAEELPSNSPLELPSESKEESKEESEE